MSKQNDDDTEEHDTEETEEEGDDEGERGEDESLGDEFRALHTQADAMQKRLMRVAATVERVGERASANVLREVSGSMGTLLVELIESVGGCMEYIEMRLDGEETESRLTEDDAEELYGVLSVCKRSHEEMAAAAPDDGTRESIRKVVELIEEKMAWVLESSEYEPDDAEPKVAQTTGTTVVGEA